jgi:hypothetical protein
MASHQLSETDVLLVAFRLAGDHLKEDDGNQYISNSKVEGGGAYDHTDCDAESESRENG